MLGEAQTAASAHPTTSSPAGCGSGTWPLNSQTEQISAGFPPARGNISCIASAFFSLALAQLQNPGSQALLGLESQGDQPLREWGFAESCILYRTDHSRFECGHLHSDEAKVPGQETQPMFPQRLQHQPMFPQRLQHQPKAPVTNPRPASQWSRGTLSVHTPTDRC